MNKNQSIGTNATVFTERFAIRSIDLGERYLRLGNWMLLNRYQIAVVTAKELFEQTGMYPHDCAGLAKKLGFTGWKEMKASLHLETVERLAYLDTEDGLAEAAIKLYRHTKRRKVQFGCPYCKSEHVFRGKGGWYLYVNNGEAEPKVKYCPECGHRLLARDKKMER